MGSRRRCKHCGSFFSPRPQNPEQSYCSLAECQKTRKREWKRHKLANDPSYRENQRAANREWRQRNPGYWREYRERHKEYTERNRKDQRQRNRRRKEIAKSDASISRTRISSGRYQLIPVTGTMFAKSDASIVEITVVSGG